jgi:hypothetical protein
MAGDYISREAALMKPMQDGCSAKNLQSISDMPAADVAEVVRCKDCKHLVNATINANGFLICDISDMEIAPDDFCSRGVTE